MVSRKILSFIRHRRVATTEDIEMAIMPYGFTQEQVLGGIGYLRSIHTVSIVSKITIGGRAQHIFS